MPILINKEKNEICVSLNKNFYDLQALKESLAKFRGICKGELKENCLVILKPKEKEMLNILGYEFCNYALGLMKNKLLV